MYNLRYSDGDGSQLAIQRDTELVRCSDSALTNSQLVWCNSQPKSLAGHKVWVVVTPSRFLHAGYCRDTIDIRVLKMRG